MKIVSRLLILLPFLIFIGCSEEITPKPGGLNASDGTHIGTILLTWNDVEGAEAHEIVRLDPQTGEWVNVGHWGLSPYWDEGFSSSSGKLIPGHEYQYKVRGHKNSSGGFGEYSDIETGYSFKPQKVEITSVTKEQDGKIKIEWNDPNDLSSVINHLSTKYHVYRAKESQLPNFEQIGYTSSIYTYDNYTSDEPLYYKVAIYYEFSIAHYSGFIEHEQSDMMKEGTGGGGDNPVINYTKADLGSITSAGGGIPFVEMKIVNGNTYLGTLEEYVTDGGKPKIYKLNGTTWQPEGGTLPAELTSDNFASMSIAAGTSNTYIAASSYVYQSDGSTWSANLAADNMGETDPPSIASIEVLNDELFAAVHVEPDGDLKVYKWSGTDWVTVGGDVSGWIEPGTTVSNVTLQDINGTLYLYYYLLDNDGFSSDLKIKHLEGTSWITDLDWSQKWLYNIQLAGNGTNLYFSSWTASYGSYKGGVYKVTSTSTVEAVADENDDWFITSYDLAIDSDGSLILSSQKYESQDLFYPSVSLYDGTEWKTISGDFSGGADPVAIGVAGTDIYFVRGDLSSENTLLDPTLLLSSKLSK